MKNNCIVLSHGLLRAYKNVFMMKRLVLGGKQVTFHWKITYNLYNLQYAYVYMFWQGESVSYAHCHSHMFNDFIGCMY